MKKLYNKKNIKKSKPKVRYVFILLLIISIFGILNATVFAKENNITTFYTVESNDTLWDIAKYICNNSNKKNINIQKTVCEIKKINNMTSSNIYEGQEIMLPIY